MPLPPIAVEIAPPDQSPQLVQLLLDACSRAASPVECVVADEAEGESVSALAIVVWLPESDAVRVQVGARRGENQGDWVNRRVLFEDSDEPPERWTAAGFVVGTLASRFLGGAPPGDQETPESEAPEPRATPETTPEPEPAEEPRSRPREPARLSRRIWLDAAALGGPLFDRGPWRIGGMLGVAYLGDEWPIFVVSAARLSFRPRDDNELVASSLEADLGVGLPLAGAATWTLDGTAAGTLERLDVKLDDPELQGIRRVHWVPGLRGRIELGWMPSEHVGGMAALGLSWWSHRTRYTVEQTRVVEQPPVVGEVSVGVRVGLP